MKNQLNGHVKPAIESAQQKQIQLQKQKLKELAEKQPNINDVDTSFIKSEPVSDDVSDKRALNFLLLNNNYYYRKERRMSWN